MGLPWAVAGAVAAIRYRLESRETTDLDLVVPWSEELEPAFLAEGWEVESVSAPDDHPHLIILRRPGRRVDLMVSVVVYQDIALDRAVANQHVLTAEDVIIHKLLAWRPRDQDDVRSILLAGHDLDRTYIEHWADEWGVKERWEQAQRGD